MSKELLELKNVSVSIEDTEILKSINLSMKKGEVHVLMGPNGAGKSTLGYAIMGHPKYFVTNGSLLFEGESIDDMSTDERARKGIYLSFQAPEEVPGVELSSFIRTSNTAVHGDEERYLQFLKRLRKEMETLSMDSSYSTRELNVGFSGGEKKKSEILQMLMLNPKLGILDETDSGLDVDAVKTVSKGVKEFLNGDNGLLIITHNSKILEEIPVDYVHIMIGGNIVANGGPELIEKVNMEGFRPFEEA